MTGRSPPVPGQGPQYIPLHTPPPQEVQPLRGQWGSQTDNGLVVDKPCRHFTVILSSPRTPSHIALDQGGRTGPLAAQPGLHPPVGTLVARLGVNR